MPERRRTVAAYSARHDRRLTQLCPAPAERVETDQQAFYAKVKTGAQGITPFDTRTKGAWPVPSCLCIFGRDWPSSVMRRLRSPHIASPRVCGGVRKQELRIGGTIARSEGGGGRSVSGRRPEYQRWLRQHRVLRWARHPRVHSRTSGPISKAAATGPGCLDQKMGFHNRHCTCTFGE